MLGCGIGKGNQVGAVEVDGDKVPPQWSTVGSVAGVGDALCYFLPVPAGGVSGGEAKGRIKVHPMPYMGDLVALVKLAVFR